MQKKYKETSELMQQCLSNFNFLSQLFDKSSKLTCKGVIYILIYVYINGIKTFQKVIFSVLDINNFEICFHTLR